MTNVMVFHCPICGMYKTFNEGEDPFEVKDLDDIEDMLTLQEVGGKVETGIGIGRGKAKGKVEVVDNFSVDDIPSEYDRIRLDLEDRLKDVLNDMP